MRRKHHDLEVYERGIALVKDVYACTASFPPDEKFGLTSQLRRAAVSIPANIAEGAARGTDREFLRFLYMARGSLSEVETHMRIARELGFSTADPLLADSIDRLFAKLGALIHNINQRPNG